jgi:CDP-glucose 4,6-dehydratase
MLEAMGIDVVGFSLQPLENSLYETSDRRRKIKESFGDINDYVTLEKFVSQTKPKHVFHFAAQPLVRESYLNPIETFKTNVIGTANLLEACRNKHQIESIVLATTDKVYKNNDSGLDFRENDSLGGKDPYSASKVGAEAAISAWRTIYKSESDTRIVSVRAGNVIGGGDYSKDRLVPDCVRAKQLNKKVTIRRPMSTRPWQHVLDPIFGYVLASQLAVNESYNFGPSEGSSLTVQQVVNLLQETLDFKYQIHEEEDAPYEANLLSLDSSLAKGDLNWQSQFGQVQAIKETGIWWARLFAGEPAKEVSMDQISEFLRNTR